MYYFSITIQINFKMPQFDICLTVFKLSVVMLYKKTGDAYVLSKNSKNSRFGSLDAN